MPKRGDVGHVLEYAPICIDDMLNQAGDLLLLGVQVIKSMSTPPFDTAPVEPLERQSPIIQTIRNSSDWRFISHHIPFV